MPVTVLSAAIQVINHPVKRKTLKQPKQPKQLRTFRAVNQQEASSKHLTKLVKQRFARGRRSHARMTFPAVLEEQAEP